MLGPLVLGNLIGASNNAFNSLWSNLRDLSCAGITGGQSPLNSS